MFGDDIDSGDIFNDEQIEEISPDLETDPFFDEYNNPIPLEELSMDNLHKFIDLLVERYKDDKANPMYIEALHDIILEIKRREFKLS
jgi:hypothetical protein